jgi:hypothetical protein
MKAPPKPPREASDRPLRLPALARMLRITCSRRRPQPTLTFRGRIMVFGRGPLADVGAGSDHLAAPAPTTVAAAGFVQSPWRPFMPGNNDCCVEYWLECKLQCKVES